MVRFIMTLVCGLLVICACRSDLAFPPRLVTGPVSDTASLILSLPDTGAVQISKNGFRAFNLAAIVADEDDADSSITWSLAAGPGLEVRLNGDTARIGPVPNEVCTSYVVFTATDPGGLNTSRTCPISVFEFLVHLDSVVMGRNSVRQTVIVYDYRPELRAGLAWDQPVSDPAWLSQCSLVDSSGSKIFRLTTGDSVGTTGVYLRVSDPANHVDFHHGIQVTIE